MSVVNDKVVVFSVCNLAYFPKVLVLAESLYRLSNRKLKVFVFDKKIEITNENVEIIWVEDLKIENFKQLAFKYDIIELSTALKPYISLFLLEKYERLIFFDPDICLYDSIDIIVKDLDNTSILLTPHYLTPQSNHISESDQGMMRFGSFNLGFFAVKNTEQGLKFLKWWSERCIDLNYMESQFGLSTDQKWVSIAPCFFDDLKISFNFGYNAAPWNSYERFITKDQEQKYIVNQKYPLIFFHFSNFDKKDPEYLNKRSTYEKGARRFDLLDLGENYAASLEKNTTGIEKYKYAYDFMSGGEYISPTLRRAYACILPELPAEHDPFDSKGIIGKFAIKNYLIQKKHLAYKPVGFSSYSYHRNKFKIIYFFLRVILRVIGPNRFQNLSRLMVFLSSYRQNRGLWKY